MTDLEAISARRSRRAYSGPLPKDQLRKLEAEIARINLESGLSLKLVEEGGAAFRGVTKSYGMFSGVHSLVEVICRKGDPDAREKAGYYGEKLVLEATKAGLGTCWVGGTYNKELLAAGLSPVMELRAVITVGPVKEKPSLVERTVRLATHAAGKSAEDIFTAEDTPPDWFTAGVQAADMAPSALNKKPVCFHWRAGRATAALEKPSDYPMVDLGIAKLHFELAAGGRFPLGDGAVFEKA